MFICQIFVIISAPLQVRYMHHTYLTRADAINGSRPHERFTKKPIRAALLFYPSYRELCVPPSGPAGRSLLWLPFLGDAPSCVEKSIVVRSGTANSSFRTSGSSGQETSGFHSIITPTPSPKSLWTQVSDHPAPRSLLSLRMMKITRKAFCVNSVFYPRGIAVVEKQLCICNRISLFVWRIYQWDSTLCTGQ